MKLDGVNFLIVGSFLLFFIAAPEPSAQCNSAVSSFDSSDGTVKYVLTYPKVLQRNGQFDFHFVLFEHKDYQLPVSFVAKLKLGARRQVHHWQTFTQTTYGIQKHSFRAEKIIQEHFNQSGFDPTISIEFDTNSLQRGYFVGETEPNLLVDRFLFLQLDKAVYKPAQSVKIAVMGVDRQLKALAGSVDVLVIDPNGKILQLWHRQALRRGFLALNFTLSDLASEGEWTLIVYDNSQTSSETRKTFAVQKYVLPKFQVSIDFPSNYWLIANEDDDYKAYVRAKYSFGKAVRGKALVSTVGSCRNRGSKVGGSTVASPILKFSNEISLAGNSSADDGLFVMDGLASALFEQSSSPVSKFPFEECQLEMTLNFTEALTGERAYAQQTIKLFKYPLAIRAYKPTAKFTKPGLPFTIRFQVGSPDGLASMKGAKVLVQVFHFREDADNCARIEDFVRSQAASPAVVQIETMTATTNANGIAEVTVTVPKESRSTAFYASLPSQPGVSFCESRSSLLQSIRNDSVSVTAFSNGNMLPKVGDKIMFVIRTTSSVPYAFLILSQNGRALEYLQVDRALVDPDHPGVMEFRLEVALPAEAAPRLSAIVWSLDSEGKSIIADAIEFSVDDFVQHRLTAAFDPTQVRPAEKTTLRIGSNDPAGSLVALLAIDKRVRYLRGGNDISLEDVLGKISSTTLAYGPKLVSAPMWRCWDCDWYPSPGAESKNVTEIFESLAISLCSNVIPPRIVLVAPLDTKSKSSLLAIGNNKPEPEDYDEDIADSVDELFAEAKDGRAHSTVSGVHTKHAKRGRPTPVVRKNFPETWLWQFLEFSPGVTEVETTFRVPDSITTWTLSALAIGESKGFGMLEKPVEMTVFQDFFVNLDVQQATIIRGEQIEVKAVVFSYRKDAAIDVELTLERSPHFDISHDGGVTFDANENNFTKSIKVEPNSGSSVPIWIRPRRLGKITLKLTGFGGEDWADAVRKEIDVEAEGEVRYANMPLLLRLDGSISVRKETILASELFGGDASVIVDGSKMFQLQVVGDILGPATANLGKNIRLPTGCGEQVMATLAPNVYIYKYLKEVNALTPEIEHRALEFVNEGYKRELGYQHEDGGFSAFGEIDRHSSTWLTAFVLRCFHAAVKFTGTEVNNSVLASAWGYLQLQSLNDGVFEESGHLLAAYMKGGASGDVSLATYIYATFAEAGAPAEFAWKSLATTRSLIVAKATDPSRKDSYFLSLAAYALSILPNDRPLSRSILDRLVSLATTKQDGALFWASRTSASSASQPSVQVETAGYALLAMLNHGDSQTGNAIAVARWLVSQQNSLGGYASTQDTVVAIHALAEANRLFVSKKSDEANVEAKFFFNDGNTKEPVTFNTVIDAEKNARLLQSFDPDRQRQELRSVEISCSGSGVVLVQLGVKYNVQDRKVLDSGDFSLSVVRAMTDPRQKRGEDSPAVVGEFTYTEPLPDSIVFLEACAKPLTDRARQAGMVVLEIGLPTGFEPDVNATLYVNEERGSPDAIEQLRRVEGGDDDGRKQLVFYFNSLGSLEQETICVLGKIVRRSTVQNVQPPMARIYAYYAPTIMFKAIPVTFNGMSATDFPDEENSHFSSSASSRFIAQF